MTDRDYADLVDPYVRAEEEAFARGKSEGLFSGIFYTLVALIALAMLLVSLHAHAASWSVEQTRGWHLPKASEREARIVVCQNNAARHEWRCFSVR